MPSCGAGQGRAARDKGPDAREGIVSVLEGRLHSANIPVRGESGGEGRPCGQKDLDNRSPCEYFWNFV
jgi:hypothetical protein